jgi:hypothetical protein
VLAEYRSEDFITTGAPKTTIGGRTRYHWENFVDAGWQERIPGKDFVVSVAAYRTAGTNYARAHALRFEWEMRGALFAFRLYKRKDQAS